MNEKKLIEKLYSYFRKAKKFPDCIEIAGVEYDMTHYDAGGYRIEYSGIIETIEIISKISRYGINGKLNKEVFNNLVIEIY